MRKLAYPRLLASSMIIFFLMFTISIAGLLYQPVTRDAEAVTIAITPIAAVDFVCQNRHNAWSPYPSDNGFIKIDGLYGTFNTPSPSYSTNRVTAVTGRFDTFDVYGNTSAPPINASITKVEVILFAKIHENINAGWFSIGFVSTSWYESVGASMEDDETYNPTGHASANWGNWHNSSVMAWNESDDEPEDQLQTAMQRWDVTSLYSWNVSMLMDADLYVMYSMIRNTSSTEYMEYLGLQYETAYYGGTSPAYYPPVDTDVNIAGLIWLLVLFLPAIALNAAMPKIGFIGGLMLMLILLGFSQSGFLYVTVVGMIAIGILIYKGD